MTIIDETAPHPDAWTEWALCREGNPERFFPPKSAPYPATVRAICERCDVRRQCLERALEAEDGLARDARFGIWGGTSPLERWRMWHEGQQVSA